MARFLNPNLKNRWQFFLMPVFLMPATNCIKLKGEMHGEKKMRFVREKNLGGALGGYGAIYIDIYRSAEMCYINVPVFRYHSFIVQTQIYRFRGVLYPPSHPQKQNPSGP